MSAKGSSLTVQPPIPQKQLGRYRAKKGVYLIRYQGAVIHIGCSSSGFYKTVMRLFQKGRKLSHLDYNKVKIEIILTTLQRSTIKNVLIRHFKPMYNDRVRPLGITTEYERRHYRRIEDCYFEQSRFEVEGEHQTDSKTLK